MIKRNRLGNVIYWRVFGVEIQHGLLSGRLTVWFRHRPWNLRKPDYRQFEVQLAERYPPTKPKCCRGNNPDRLCLKFGCPQDPNWKGDGCGP